MRGRKTQDRDVCPPFRNAVFRKMESFVITKLVVGVSTNFVYTTEYLKLRVGKQSSAIELRSLNGKIVSREADMLSSTAAGGWHEVGVEQLNTYRAQFPVVKCWLKLIGQR